MVQKEGGQRNDHGALVGQVSQCILSCLPRIYMFMGGILTIFKIISQLYNKRGGDN